jgi:hypothetical protein
MLTRILSKDFIFMGSAGCADPRRLEITFDNTDFDRNKLGSTVTDTGIHKSDQDGMNHDLKSIISS